MINFTFHMPGPPLDDFVELLWYYEIDEPSRHPMERVLPTGAAELVINLREDEIRSYDSHDPARFERFPGSVVAGTRSEFMVIDTACQESIVGVHFKLGGAFPFFGVAACELHDLDVSLDALWGRPAVDLRERLIEAPSPAAKFRILEAALLARMRQSRMRRPRERHPAVDLALDELRVATSARKLADVAREAGLSQRRFIQLFREQVGTTPKLHYRIQRFQAALRAIEAGRTIEWADLALSCGYYDQAHFIRDFKAFSGINPSTYLAQRGSHPNHVAMLD
jgi:AraC-like DNA-binding protein